ncbi:hypothetical protein D3C78_1309400 [compost metagenome]
MENGSCSSQPVDFTVYKRFRRGLEPSSLAWLAILVYEQIVLRSMDGFVLSASSDCKVKFISIEVTDPYG